MPYNKTNEYYKKLIQAVAYKSRELEFFQAMIELELATRMVSNDFEEINRTKLFKCNGTPYKVFSAYAHMTRHRWLCDWSLAEWGTYIPDKCREFQNRIYRDDGHLCSKAQQSANWPHQGNIDALQVSYQPFAESRIVINHKFHLPPLRLPNSARANESMIHRRNRW